MLHILLDYSSHDKIKGATFSLEQNEANFIGGIYSLKIGGVFERGAYAYAILGGQLCFEFCLFLLGGG